MKPVSTAHITRLLSRIDRAARLDRAYAKEAAAKRAMDGIGDRSNADFMDAQAAHDAALTILNSLRCDSK